MKLVNTQFSLVRSYAHSVTAIDRMNSPGSVEVVYRIYTLEQTGWISIMDLMTLTEMRVAPGLRPA